MLHGREYSKRILDVNPPMGRASGPSVCPIGRSPRDRARRRSIDGANVSKTAPTPRQIWLRTHDLASPLPWIPPRRGAVVSLPYQPYRCISQRDGIADRLTPPRRLQARRSPLPPTQRPRSLRRGFLAAGKPRRETTRAISWWGSR
jgi:hypothetical protein